MTNSIIVEQISDLPGLVPGSERQQKGTVRIDDSSGKITIALSLSIELRDLIIGNGVFLSRLFNFWLLVLCCSASELVQMVLGSILEGADSSRKQLFLEKTKVERKDSYMY